MAEKKVIGNLKLRIPAGRATAGPPVGSTLGQWGLNMMDFINPFNEATKDLMGKNVIVHIRVFEDRTFDWKSLGQPVDDLIREAIKIDKGSGKPNTEKVGKITKAQLQEIAEKKMYYLATAQAVHMHVKSDKGDPVKRFKAWGKSRCYFIDKYSQDSWFGKQIAKLSMKMYVLAFVIYNKLKQIRNIKNLRYLE